MTARCFAGLAAGCSLFVLATAQPLLANEPDWKQFGGPHRDFSVPEDPGIATSWGDAGPRVLWRRPLGEHGHSSIVVEGDTWYTTYRQGDQDVLLAGDLASGETKWERSYDAPLDENHNYQFGPGPHSTPLVAGDRVFAASAGTLVSGFDKATGEPVWQRDLRAEEEVSPMFRGYGSSPVAWGDLLILNGGGNGQGVIALRQSDGSTVWKALDGGGYPSPQLMEIDGVEQVVVALGPRHAGIDPATGEVLWQLELPESAQVTIATPVRVGPNQIFTTSAYGDGSRLYEVRRVDGQWQAEEKWYSRKMQVMHGAVAHIGNHVYGSSGDFGPTFLSAVDLDTGELTFRQRGFSKANVIRVGERVLILDEDGTLGLGDPSPEGIEVLAEATVLDGVSWTAPVLVGTTLLVRDREEIVALDLASSAGVTTTDSAVGDESAAPREDFARTAAGLSVNVPAELLDAGAVYYVSPGEDMQLLVQSTTPLQRTAMVSDRVIGAMVVPFDLESADPVERPILAGSVRLPVHSLQGGGTQTRSLLIGPRGLDAQAHPEIVVTFLGAENVERLPGDDSDQLRISLLAKARIEANGQATEVEAPVELLLQRTSLATMNRNVGDLATLRSSIELDVAELGIQIPPPLAMILSSTVTVDLFLGFSTVTPDKNVYDPSVSQEHFEEETRFVVLARDLGDDVAAYAHFRALMRESWDDAARLERLATAVVVTPGLERRNLGLAFEAAARADELEGGEDALLLNTLARIEYERGNVDEAIAAQRRALELVDEQQPAARPALEANLSRYEGARSSG